MANFSDLYPTATNEVASARHDGYPAVVFMECKTDPCKHTCGVCKEKTHWYNTTTGLPVCSTECNSKHWDFIFTNFVAQQVRGVI